MEVEVNIKQDVECKRHLRRQKEVSIQDDVFVNRNLDLEDEVEDLVFLNERPHYDNKFTAGSNNFRKPFNHLSKRTKLLNQTLFASHKTNSNETKSQFNFHLESGFGWVVVFLVFLLRLIISAPILNFNQLYFYLKLKVFPDQNTEIVGCLNQISGHLVSPLLTILVFKYKALRLFTILGCILTALSLLFSAFSFQYHQFVLAFALMNGIFGELTRVCSTMIINQYFKRKLYLVEMIICLSNGVSYSLFGILIHFLYSKYGWRKSLQILSILTWFSLIFALFFRPISSIIYHPQRRAILHFKQHFKQERQQKSKRPINRDNYRLSEHFFRQQSLEIIKDGLKLDNKNDNRNASIRTGSVSSSGLSTGLNTTHSNLANKANDSMKSDDMQISSDVNGNSNDQFKQSKFKNKQNEKAFTSFFQQRQSTTRQTSISSSFNRVSTSVKRTFCLFNCFNRDCLNSSTKLIRSNNLIEYLNLLKLRDFKFIIIFCLLSTTSQTYLSYQSIYTDNQCAHPMLNTTIATANTVQPTDQNISQPTYGLVKAAIYDSKDLKVQKEQLNKLTSLESHLTPSMTTENRTKNLNLINSISLISLSRAKQSNLIDQASALDLLYLNLWFSLGYSLSLVLTSVLVSRLYLTSKNSCKLGLAGSCLNVIMISMLNSCLFRNCFNQSNLDTIDKRSALDENSKEIVYEYTNLSIRLLEFIRTNVYFLQISLFVVYGYFQAKLNYSLQMLLIERFSNKKLTKAISLQRFTIGFGQLCLLSFRAILNYLNELISIESFCGFDCGVLVSSFFIFISTLTAIIILHFISNRSINRFRSKKNKQTKVVNENSFVIKVFLRKFFKVFHLFKFDSLARRSNSKNQKDKLNSNLYEKRFKYKKQLSDSNLNFIGRFGLSPKKSKLSRFNSDLNLLKTIDNQSGKTNYLIDCILCGKSCLVSLDLERLQLTELFSIEKVENGEINNKELELHKRTADRIHN